MGSYDQFVSKHPYLEKTWVIGWYVDRKKWLLAAKTQWQRYSAGVKYTRHVNLESAQRFAKKWGLEIPQEGK